MMAGIRALPSLINEETVQLTWFEAFMRGRIELEQQMISGLQALLEGVPPLPGRKLLWHRALKELLDGTRDELHTRMEELERLKDQVRAVGMSIVNAEMYIRDLNFEVEKLESTESVDFCDAATATLHKDWLDKVIVQKSLSDLFASKEKLENKKASKAQETFRKYYEQDLIYRYTVYQQRKSQENFLNSIPARVQEYGTKYWTAVCDVSTMMESFANYLRNIASTCNSSGSAIWASAKNIKPLVDANCHTEAIEQSPIRFSPIDYRNHGSKSPNPSVQTILFGRPLELYNVGELKKIPPVLEYLLDSVQDWPISYFGYYYNVDQKHVFDSVMEKCWPLANELEKAWTGVEESDRAIISNIVLQDNHRLLLMGYFLALQKPAWSGDDIDVAVRNAPSPTWNAWDKDPTKMAVLRAIVSCQVRLGENAHFGWDIVDTLAQRYVPFGIGGTLLSLARHPDFWRSAVGNVTDEDQ